jgi:ABC-type transport system substrate-binding protein
LVGDWDPAITDWYNALAEQYLWQTCEVPIGTPIYYSAGTQQPLEDEWIGILVTDWVLESRPSQNNSLGFNNTGGYKSATLTLRENVTFHDGSNWNATVYKWNIDRHYIISMNVTGAAQGNDDWEEEEGNLMGTIPVEDWKPYFTEDWNMTHFDSPNLGLTPPTTDPGVTDYAYYDLGPNRSLVEYPGVTILPNGTIRNPNPYGGWDTAASAAIHWAPYDRYPTVDYVEILENKASGGKVKIHYNTWNTEGVGGWGVNAPMISYDTYKDDYTIHGIYGYENDVKSTNNPSIVDHMIGTGAYKFIEHDETGTPPGGHMLKNDNYWNKTALESEGWFDAERVEVIKFPAGELGRDALNTALLTHAIDYTWDSMFMQLDYNSIQANPGIRYEDAAPSEYKTNIVMNAINETWYAWPWADAWRMGQYPLAGNFSAGGVPMALRKAMSFAYNYPLLIQTVKNNRVAQNGGVLGKANLYYNSSIPIADYNVTKAREILLTTETDISGEVYTGIGLANGYNPSNDLYNFSKMCADRGLTASSPEADWIQVANTNPIYTLNFYYDSAHEDDKTVLETSLKAIGVALVQKTTNKVTTIIWDTVRIGHLTTFDGDHSLFSCNAWIMDEHMPHDSPSLNTFWHYVDPDRGRWRTLGGAGITSWHYWGNFGFNFNTDCDQAYDRLAVSAPVDKKESFSVIANVQQQWKYGVMFLYEALEGWAMWRDWETFLIEGRSGELGGLWGGVSNHFVKHVSLEETIELIPGAPLIITMTVMAVSTIGIIYALMRKKRLR